jgi:hypothetical protein
MIVASCLPTIIIYQCLAFGHSVCRQYHFSRLPVSWMVFQLRSVTLDYHQYIFGNFVEVEGAVCRDGWRPRCSMQPCCTATWHIWRRHVTGELGSRSCPVFHWGQRQLPTIPGDFLRQLQNWNLCPVAEEQSTHHLARILGISWHRVTDWGPRHNMGVCKKPRVYSFSLPWSPMSFHSKKR